jgi:HEAT repeat protein
MPGLERLLERLFGEPPNTYELGQRHDTAGLLAALGHSLPWVRCNAAATLGKMHALEARGPLTAALHDSDADVRQAAQAALDRLRDRATAPAA